MQLRLDALSLRATRMVLIVLSLGLVGASALAIKYFQDHAQTAALLEQERKAASGLQAQLDATRKALEKSDLQLKEVNRGASAQEDLRDSV